MTGQFEREVNHALEIFIANVREVAERAAIAAIRSAFVRGSAHASRHAVAPADNNGPAPHEVRRHPAPASATPAAVSVDRLITVIREHAGWRTGQIAWHLGIHTSKLRLHLRKLVAAGTIRIEERAIGVGGRKYRTYFVVEHTDGQLAESPVIPGEATA